MLGQAAKEQAVHPHLLEGSRLDGMLALGPHDPGHRTTAKGQAMHPHILEGGRLHEMLPPHDREAKAGQAARRLQDLAKLKGSSLYGTLALEGDRLQGMLPLGRGEAVKLQINRSPHGTLGLGLVKVRLHSHHVGRTDPE